MLRGFGATRIVGQIASATGAAFVLLILSSLNHAAVRPSWLGFAAVLASGCVAWRPRDSLFILAACLPLSAVLGGFVEPSRSLAEPLVLVALAGWLMRRTFEPSPRTLPVALRKPSTLFGLVVATSLLVHLVVSQTFFGSLSSELWTLLSRSYFTAPSEFRAVAAAALLLEGLGLYSCVATCVTDARARRGVMGMMAVGATAAAALNINRLLTLALRTGDSVSALPELATRLRINVHYGDVNAAGSYFALSLFVALGLAAYPAHGRRQPFAWGVAVAILAGGLWLTGSRAALLAAGAVAIVQLLVAAFNNRRTLLVRASAAALAAGIVAAALAIHLDNPDKFAGVPARESLRTRLEILSLGVRMAGTHPVFGVGVGAFYDRWPEFATTTLKANYDRENAHNNFLQILAELGVVGLLLFVWLIVATMGRARSNGQLRASEETGVALGLIAFLLTCLAGHPLLTREVAYCFWMALGLVATGGPMATHTEEVLKRRHVMAAVAALLIVSSVPLRTMAARREANLENVGLGMSEWYRDESGSWVRTLVGDATVFVPSDAPSVVIPLRATTSGTPVTLHLHLDGKIIDHVVLVDGAWRHQRVILPKRGNSRFRRMEIKYVPGTPAADHHVQLGKLYYPAWKP